ncbi:MAG: DUF4410 domain-containing protein [Acidobacteriota bacterium]
MRTLTRIGIALLLFGAVALPAAAARKSKAAPTAPGVYVDWKNEVDELEIVEPFKLSDYETVSVEAFDTKDTPLPEADDNTYAPVKSVLADPAGPFTQGLAGGVGDRIDVSRDSGGGARSIVLRIRVEEMDPGSRAARYWAGFGAGAARTRLAGEAVDSETGKVLFRFKQERRSGVGMYGGSYVELLNRNLVTIGEDVALVFSAF